MDSYRVIRSNLPEAFRSSRLQKHPFYPFTYPCMVVPWFGPVPASLPFYRFYLAIQ